VQGGGAQGSRWRTWARGLQAWPWAPVLVTCSFWPWCVYCHSFCSVAAVSLGEAGGGGLGAAGGVPAPERKALWPAIGSAWHNVCGWHLYDTRQQLLMEGCGAIAGAIAEAALGSSVQCVLSV
jgi:hypothetical protein